MEDIKVEDHLRLFEAKKENVRKTMERIKSEASDVLVFTLQWNDLEEHLNLTETKVEERFRKVKSKEMELQKEGTALEERAAEMREFEKKAHGFRTQIEDKRKELDFLKDRVECCVGEFKVEEMRLTQLRISVEECVLEQRSKASQLDEMVESLSKTHAELELKEAQLRHMDTHLERKSKDLTLVEELLETKEKKLQGLKEAERCSTMDLDLREHLLKETCQQVESKSKELEDIERLIEERTAHYESIKMLIEEHAEELASKEKKQNEITEAIHKLSLDISSKEKTLERAKVFIEQLSEKQQLKEEKLDATKRHLERSIAEYNSKKKELHSVKDKLGECLQNLEVKEDKLNLLQSLITQRNEEVEEGEKKAHDLVNSNKELLRQLQLKKEEVCSINNAIRECSGDLESKRRQYDQLQTSITDLTAQVKSKECNLFSVKKKIEESLKDLQSKEEQQVRLEASLMEREQKLGLKEKQFEARSEKIELKEKDLDAREKKIDEKNQEVAKCVKECERKAKELFSFLQQGNSGQHVNLLRDANVRDDKTLQLLLQGHLKKCPQLYHDVSNALKTSSDPEKLALDTIQELYSAHQRMAISNRDPNGFRRSIICLLDCLMDISPKPKAEIQGEAMKFAIECKNITLVKAENPVEVFCFFHLLAAFSLAFTFEPDKVHNLFDATLLGKYAPSLCEALGVSALAPVTSVTNEQQPPEGPIISSSGSLSPDVQNMATLSELANGDVLRNHDVSTSFSPNEVSTELPLLDDPGKFVLNSVKDALTGAHQRGESSLAEPIVKTLLPLLEELTRLVSSIDPDLQLDAAKVAQRWSMMMATSRQPSLLEALGFLQFIVAYGLVDRTKQNETLPFALYITHFKQAPKLFHSLGLTNAIPSLVKQLLETRRYIPAVRFMVFFNLNVGCDPLLFLKEEISNLRRSAKENRIFESQDEDKDAGKLREIIELIEDLKLEIDLPVDVIVKFMVPRKTPDQSRCIVPSCVPIQPPQILPLLVHHMQASHSSYNGTRGLNQSYPTRLGVSQNQQMVDVERYQADGSTAFHGQSSQQGGIKRARVDSRCLRAAIRPCFDASGSGRF